MGILPVIALVIMLLIFLVFIFLFLTILNHAVDRIIKPGNNSRWLLKFASPILAIFLASAIMWGLTLITGKILTGFLKQTL